MVIKRRCLKIYVVLLVGVIFWNVQVCGLVQAEQAVADNLDIMFVLDTSYSTNQTDKDGISIEMLKLFTDISYLSHTRIGFVSFNDSIQFFQPLIALKNSQDKQAFKQSLAGIERKGRTDTGLGLKKAWQLLLDNQGDRPAALVLMTDGEIDIDPDNSERTANDSLKDVDAVIKEASLKHVPIYTVAMGRNGVDMNLLQHIAQKTGGISYIADIPQDLITVFNNVFAQGFKSRIVPVASVTATGQQQEINIKIPDKYAAEVNLMFLSSSALKEAQVFYGSNSIDIENTQHYSSIKIPKPNQKTVKILFKGVPQDVIKVNMLIHYDLKGQVQVDKQPQSKETANFTAWLTDNSGQPIFDKNLYETFSAQAVFKNLDTGEEIKVPVQRGDKGWQVQNNFTKAGKYSVSVEADNEYYHVTTPTVEFQVSDGAWLQKGAIVFLVIAIAGMIYWREKRARPHFTGKINAYYLRLSSPEEEEIPPVTVLLKELPKKKISLYDMLHTVDADKGLTAGEQIWFTPGIDKTLILSHNSVCTILIGQNVLCKNQNYILHYGDKIYVTFPEYGEEIELHYKHAKSSEVSS